MREHKKLLLTIDGILCVCWLALFLLLGDLRFANPGALVGFIFGILGFAAVAAAVVLLPQNSNDSSADFPPLLITILYLIISTLLNTLLVFVGAWLFVVFPFIVRFALLLNILLTGAYLIAMLVMLRGAASIHEKADLASGQIAHTQQISRTLGNLLALAPTDQVQAALRSLKETVDFSTNTTCAAALPAEREMLSALDDLSNSLGTDPEPVLLQKISRAGSIWAHRNTEMK